MSPGLVLLLLLLLQDASSFHLPSSETRLQEKSSRNASISKILGGERAELGEYPFIVSMEYGGRHFCGGSVISSNWVLTASHCISGFSDTESLMIRAGSLVKQEGGSLHHVQQILEHPEYSTPLMYDNDVALIKVREQLTAGNYVKAVHLGKTRDVPKDGEPVVSCGWGITSSTGLGSTSTYLLDATLSAVDNSKCDSSAGIQRIRQRAFNTIKISDNMICAVARGKDTTKGDSGGPLLTYNQARDPLQVGVVSWGEGNGHLDSPGVYANVANFIPWIYMHTVTLP